MTVRATGRPLTRLEIAQEHAGRLFGPRTADRLAAFDNGTLYVRAGEAARFLAWLIDMTVFVLGVGAGVVVLALVAVARGLSDGVVTLVAISLFLAVPMLYGLFYGNGRALGAVLTGTQLVRAKDGGRVGSRACWAMLVRTLLMPALFFAVVTAALGGAGGGPGSVTRTSIDPAATRRLHAAGIR
ncbi:RDD family protein [Micromonospora sp. NPDC047074]|uniref:RDD family protein n=1 Tax=Micromonospora sp. NPDC047074 TaxID=3154339 RepID=UPI0033D4E0B3